MLDVDRVGKQAELGALIGVSEAAVSDLVRRGVIRPGDTLGEQLRAYVGHLRAQAAGRIEPPGLTEQRERLIRARAEAAELELRRRRAELVEVAAVEAAVAPLLLGARGAMLTWSARLAPVLAREESAGAIDGLLQAEIRALLAQLAALPTAVREVARAA